MATDSACAPVIRVRVKHVSTIKEGWRLDETTVEIEDRGDSDELWIRPMLAAHLYAAYEAGADEAERRNTVEGRR